MNAFIFHQLILTTLAAGSLTPRTDAIRMVAALESLIEIGLVTASVTWIIMIYPALGRLRALARWRTVLARAQDKLNTNLLTDDSTAVIRNLARRVVRARVDQFCGKPSTCAV